MVLLTKLVKSTKLDRIENEDECPLGITYRITGGTLCHKTLVCVTVFDSQRSALGLTTLVMAFSLKYKNRIQ